MPSDRDPRQQERRMTRRHKYTCLKCGQPYFIDTVDPLPEGTRYCGRCRQDAEVKLAMEKAWEEQEGREAAGAR